MESSEELCASCKSISFIDLLRGFQHDLSYPNMLRSAKSCPLCLLFVFSFSKLQLLEPDAILDRYETWIPKLESSKYMKRHAGSFIGSIYDSLEDPPRHLSWWPHSGAASARLDRGSANDGYGIQVYAPQGSLYSHHGFVPTSDVQHPGHSRNMTAFRGWLNECEYHHSKCRLSFGGSDCNGGSLAQLPTRVVKVTLKPNDMGTNCTLAALFITNGMKGRYLSLSHRWNQRGQFQTTRENVSGLQQGLPNTLSATLHHAILMTALLDFEYLWVDTLCIIQDDPEDRIREISRMADIFENATCMLAAVDTVKPDGTDSGLFDRQALGPPPLHMSCALWDKSLNPEEPDTTHVTSPTDSMGDVPHFVDTIGLKIANPQGWYVVRHSEWHRRGWIMQERMLSRRTIYFTKYKTFWDCRESSGQEDRIGTIPWSPHRNMPGNYHEDPRNQPSFVDLNNASQQWSWLVEEYSNCLLTNEEDKVIAIDGIRQRFEKRLNTEIHYGILLDTAGCFAASSLLWLAERTLDRYQRYTAPSWSWMSLRGPVTYSKFPVLATSVQQNLISCPSVEGTSLRFKAILRPAALGKVVRDLGLLRYEEYLPITGSAIYGEGFQIRKDGVLRPMGQEVPHPGLPIQTRTLKSCRNGSIIGWAVLDTDYLDVHDVLCAAVQAVTQPGHSEHGAREEHVDVILLERVSSEAHNAWQKKFRRLGRGAVVMSSWLQQDLETLQDITIV